MTKKFLSILLTVALVFNQSLFYIPLAFAQEATSSAVESPEPTPTPEPSATPTPSPELSSEPSPTPDASVEPSPSPTPSPSPSPEASSSATPTPVPSQEPSPTPTASPSATPTPTPSEATASSKLTGEYVEGEVIVKFKEEEIDLDAPAGEVESVIFEIQHDVEIKEEVEDLNVALVESDKSTSELVIELQNDPNVERVTPNYIRRAAATPNDTNFENLWGLHNTGQIVNGTAGTADSDIDAPEAWDLETSDQTDVIVAVLDTGVLYTHPDLAANMWDGSSSCKNENGETIVGGCPNYGWDFYGNGVNGGDNDPMDEDGHGTHVSGTLAAISNNSTGISGISIGNNFKIMVLRFIGPDGGSVFDEIRAINFARYNGAQVINASFGTAGFVQEEKDVIDAFSGLFVAAAGNDGVNNDSDPNAAYPCSYDSANIVCVSATGQNDTLASFSNYGATTVDVGAPGVNIYSTSLSNGYAFLDGTSMATPHVAGLAALLFSYNSNITTSQAKDKTINTGDAVDSLSGMTATGRRINTFSALSQTPSGDVLINEFIPDPIKVSDADGEWIEVLNNSSSVVNLSGWIVNDGTDHTISADYNIPPSGYAVICRNDDSALNGGVKCNYQASMVLANSGDIIVLKNLDNNTVDQITYSGSNVTPGKSIKVASDESRALSTETVFTYGLGDFGTPANNTVSVGNHSFPTIQDAINAAEPSDTINVAAGEYVETIYIDRSLTLTGAGRANTTIVEYDCWGDPTITIEVNDVTVENFTIDNDGCGGSVIGVGYDTGNGYTGVTIQDNKLINGYYGVELSGGSSDIQILNNQIFGNGGDGIYSGGGGLSDLTISGNEIGSQNQPNDNNGINLNQITGTVVIDDNTVSANGIDWGSSGININEVIDSTNTLNIDGNDVLGNGYHGIYLGSIVNSTVNIGSSEANTIENNNEAGLYIENIDQDSTVNIENNIINGNNIWQDYAGVYLGAINQSISTVNIQNNSISNNFRYGVYVYSIQDSTLNMAGNTIDNNTAQGIYLEQASGSEITIGEGNIITNNDDAGIYLGGVTGVNITGNTIQNNGLGSETTGIVINSASGNEAHNNIISDNGSVGVENGDGENFFDARENFWGDSSGPFNETSNPAGLGNSVGDNVFYRPFYTDSDKTTSSTFEVSGTSFNPSSLFTTGLFSLPDGTTDQTSTTSVTVNEEFTISVSTEDGTSSVLLPAGTTITRFGGGELDSTLLASSDVNPSDLSGFASGDVVDGAMQWGIPNLGLEFSQAITLNIFVGTDLNGQTLNVQRSPSLDSGWTSDGIVAPATCLVGEFVSGVCRFQATKASYYATTRTVSTPSTTSDGGGGSLSAAGAPSCNDAKPGSAPTLISAVAGANSVTLTWTKATGPATYYLVNYSTTPGIFQFGNPNVGGPDTTSYTVSGLSGGTTYYFKVRAGNGCMPGDYSNEVVATPSGGFISGPAAGFIAGVLGAKETVEKEQVKGEGAAADLQPSPTTYPITPNPLTILLEAMGGLLAGIAGFLSRLFGR